MRPGASSTSPYRRAASGRTAAWRCSACGRARRWHRRQRAPGRRPHAGIPAEQLPGLGLGFTGSCSAASAGHCTTSSPGRRSSHRGTRGRPGCRSCPGADQGFRGSRRASWFRFLSRATTECLLRMRPRSLGLPGGRHGAAGPPPPRPVFAGGRISPTRMRRRAVSVPSRSRPSMPPSVGWAEIGAAPAVARRSSPDARRHRHQHERAQEPHDQPDPQQPLPGRASLDPDEEASLERGGVGRY